MDKKVLLQELADGVARRANVGKKEAEQFVRVVFDVVAQHLETDKLVKIKGLGTFKLVSVDSRESVDVNTGERIRIKGHTKVSFTPDTVLRDHVNKPFAQFETVIINDGTDLVEMERLEDEPAEVETGEQAGDQTVTDASVVEGRGEEVSDNPAPIEEEPLQETPVSIVAEDLVPEDRTEAETAAEPEASKTEAEAVSNKEKTSVRTHAMAEEAPSQSVFIDRQQVEYQRMGSQTIEDQSVSAQRVEHQTVANQNIVQQGTPEKERRGMRLTLWGVILLLLVMLALMVGSYFAGYYRLLCPYCGFWDENGSASDRALSGTTVSAGPELSASHAGVRSDTVAGSNDTLQRGTAVVDSLIVPVRNDSAEFSRKSAPVVKNEDKRTGMSSTDVVRPATPTVRVSDTVVSQKADNRDTARYTQVEGGKYVITGTRGEHTVAGGETLRSIAKRVYGSKGYYVYIIAHNAIKNPDHVEAGKVLKLPELKLRAE